MCAEIGWSGSDYSHSEFVIGTHYLKRRTCLPLKGEDLYHASFRPISKCSSVTNITTIDTHFGLFQYTRLPFGFASTPAVFQRAMDEILCGIPGVICYILDDILITGTTEAEHLAR